MPHQTTRPEGPSSAINHRSSSSSSSRSVSPSSSSYPPLSPSQPSTQDKPPPLRSSQTDDDSKPTDRESPHEATSRRLPTRAWNEKDEVHRLSLHRLTYSDARVNPPPPSLWMRLALVGLCAVLVWAAFSARLGIWERKREASRVALRHAREHAVPIPNAHVGGGYKTRPTAVPSFAQAAAPARDEI